MRPTTPLLVIGLCLLLGCEREPSKSESPPVQTPPPIAHAASALPTAADGIDTAQARELSDEVAAVVTAEDTTGIAAAVRAKMETRYREAVTDAQTRTTLEQLFAQYGRPLEVEFKFQGAGHKLYSDGVTKPMRQFFYALRTSTHAKGTYFLVVEVVPDGGASLACSGIMIRAYVGGTPPMLR